MNKFLCILFGHKYFFIDVCDGEIKPFCKRCGLSVNFPCVKIPSNAHQLEVVLYFLKYYSRKFGNLAIQKKES